MTDWRRLAGSAVLAFVALSCTNEAGNPEEPSIRAGELESHLTGMVAAPSMTRQAEPVNPAFSFTPDQREIAVIVQVGKLDEDPPVDITWYQVGDEGAEELFSHTVDVGSFDRAFSIGVNPGTLATGMYRVTATLAGETTELSFAVGSDSGTDGARSGADAGDPPTAGDSGSIASEAGSSDPPDIMVLFSPPDGETWQDHQAGIVEFSAIVSGGGRPAEVSAGADGAPPAPFIDFTSPAAPEDVQTLDLFVDPCTVAGGSDLPGTVITLIGTNGDYEADAEATLGPDTLAPAITATSEPSTFSRVAPGDEITFEVAAEELAFGGPWQTGVRRIELREEGGATFFEEEFGEAPLPCGRKSWEQTITATYTVPEDPPPIIEIVATAQDFGSGLAIPVPTIPQESRFLFYTGEIWTGTMHTETFYGDPLSFCNGIVDTSLRLVVASDGSVTGEARANGPDERCVVIGDQGTIRVNMPGTNLTTEVAGTKTPNEFRITFLGVGEGRLGSGFVPTITLEHMIPITGPTVAKGKYRLSHGPGAHTDNTVRLDCGGCEQDVG